MVDAIGNGVLIMSLRPVINCVGGWGEIGMVRAKFLHLAEGNW